VDIFWQPARGALILSIRKELGAGEAITLEIPRAAGLCVPADGRLLQQVRGGCC
jgi:hypothetical protein